jgi:SAGA-associated factor 73
MAAIARSKPQPLVQHPLITTKSKYRYVRIKEQMSHAMGVRGGGGLFSADDSQPLFGGLLFQSVAADMDSSPLVPNAESDVSGARKTPVTAS